MSILVSLYSKIRGYNCGINYILPVNRWLDRKIKLDTKIVSKILY